MRPVLIVHNTKPDATRLEVMRRTVFQQIPVGSTPEQMKAFLARNFRGVRYQVLTSRPRFRGNWLVWPAGPQIYFRAYDYKALSAVEYVEIHLMLDDKERLEDVVIYWDNVSM